MYTWILSTLSALQLADTERLELNWATERVIDDVSELQLQWKWVRRERAETRELGGMAVNGVCERFSESRARVQQ